jgi:hypothetical protein
MVDRRRYKGRGKKELDLLDPTHHPSRLLLYQTNPCTAAHSLNYLRTSPLHQAYDPVR